MEIIIIVWLGILGAIMGSFLGCMGYRIPNKIKTTYPSSFCSNCRNPLKWYMNIPIISYIVQGGKCAYCKYEIEFLYFLNEILGCGLFILNYALFKFTLPFFISTILTCVLLVTMVSDFKYYYISDRVLIISSIALLITFLVFLEPMDLLVRVISAVVLFLFMIGVKILGNGMFGKESLGDGDIKLMAVIAFAIGWLDSFVTLFFAAVIALIFSAIKMLRNNEHMIPFGPFLIMGALLVTYFAQYIDPYLKMLFAL